MAAAELVPAIEVLLRRIAHCALEIATTAARLGARQREALRLFASVLRDTVPTTDASLLIMKTARGALKETFCPVSAAVEAFDAMLSVFVGQLAAMAHVLFAAQRHIAPTGAHGATPHYRAAMMTLALQLHTFAGTISWVSRRSVLDYTIALMTLNAAALQLAEKPWRAAHGVTDTATLAAFIARFVFDFAIVVRHVADVLRLDVGMASSMRVTQEEQVCLSALKLLAYNDCERFGTAVSMLFVVTDEIVAYVQDRVHFQSTLGELTAETPDFLGDFCAGEIAMLVVFPSKKYRFYEATGPSSLALLMLDSDDAIFAAIPEHIAYLIVLTLFRDGYDASVVDTLHAVCCIATVVGTANAADMRLLSKVLLQIAANDADRAHIVPWAQAFRAAAVAHEYCTAMYDAIVGDAAAFDKLGVWLCATQCMNKDQSDAGRLRCALCHGVSYCSKECLKADWNDHRKTCVPTTSPYVSVDKSWHFAPEIGAWNFVPFLTEAGACVVLQ